MDLQGVVSVFSGMGGMIVWRVAVGAVALRLSPALVWCSVV